MTQRIIEIDSPLFIAEEQAPPGTDPNTFFPHRHPLALEIGCGIGDFILQRAAQFPQHNHPAIDIYNKACLKTCRTLDATRLDQQPRQVRRLHIPAPLALPERAEDPGQTDHAR